MAALTITLSFSQSTYPKKIVWQNDTVIIIDKQQLIRINRSLNDGIYAEKTIRVLQSELNVSDSLCTYWRELYFKSDTIGNLERKKYDELKKVNEYLENSIKNEKRKNKKVTIGVGVGSVLLGIILGVLL